MKKLVIGSDRGRGVHADRLSRPTFAARPTYTKAPMMAQTPSWTGFYIFGGARRRHLGCDDIVKRPPRWRR